MSTADEDIRDHYGLPPAAIQQREESAMQKIEIDAATSLLLQFSEWRDGRTVGDVTPYDDLIAEFLAQRNVLALPFVEGVPAGV